MASKVTFPKPPPTTNELTAEHRTQLLRTSRKLGKVLGSVPRWNDDEPETGDEAQQPNTHYLTLPLSRSSIEELQPTFRPASPVLMHPPKTENVKPRKTFLKFFSSSKPTEASTPEAVLPEPPVFSLPAPLPTPKEDLDTSSMTSSIAEFNVAKIRRSKMDRLRRRLGDDVPVDMVFPDAIEEDDEEDSDAFVHPVTTYTPPIPEGATTTGKPSPNDSPIKDTSPNPGPSHKSVARSHRDSLLLLDVHKVPRKIKRVPVPSYHESIVEDGLESIIELEEAMSSGVDLDLDPLLKASSEWFSTYDVDEEENSREGNSAWFDLAADTASDVSFCTSASQRSPTRSHVSAWSSDDLSLYSPSYEDDANASDSDNASQVLSDSSSTATSLALSPITPVDTPSSWKGKNKGAKMKKSTKIWVEEEAQMMF